MEPLQAWKPTTMMYTNQNQNHQKQTQNLQKRTQNPQKRTHKPQKITHMTNLQSKNIYRANGISSGYKEMKTYSYINAQCRNTVPTQRLWWLNKPWRGA